MSLSLSGPGFAEDDVALDAPAVDAAQAAAPDGEAALLGQLPIPLAAGDVALTGFSGVKLATPVLPAGVDPLEKTVIDADGISLRILDLTSLGGPALGQVLNPPVKLAIPARDIGQVFALAFDDGGGAAGTGVPNLYAAATSLYGLQIVGDPAEDGSVTRLKAGDPRARFMDGQFGSLPGAGPGAVWRIDGTTGAVTHLADTAFSGVLNSGPGIGDLAFDPQSRNLYASDLDTGLIHRFDLEHNAADLGQFDHGMSGRPGAELPSLADDGARADILSPDFHADDPATWGFTQPQRRVEALAVHDGRLYYSVADGPAIWSVALQPDGSFDVTARLELPVDAGQPFHVTDIVFDPQGRMILAQRAAQQSPFDYGQFTAGNAQTLRYRPAAPGEAGANLWVPDPEEYPIGLPDGNRQGAGGITLTRAYNPDGTPGDACAATLVTTGDDLRDSPALAGQLPPGPVNLHGIQLNDAELVLPQNVPPVATAFAAFDPAHTDPAARGHVGDVEAVPCAGAPGGTDSGLLGPEPDFSEPGPDFGGPIFPDGVPPVLVPLPQGGFGAGLTLSKFPLVETCTEDGGCAFVITVHNPGPDPFPGPFAIDDVFTDGEGGPLAGAKLTLPPDPDWDCSPDLPLRCVHPDPLPVGDTSLNLTFAPGDLGGLDDVVNCVLPADPDGPRGGLDDDPADPLPQPAPAMIAPPPLPVVSDKDGLKVMVNPKVPSCSAANGGCDFEVQLTNTGQVPVKGPLTFVLKASLGADPAQAVIDGTPVSLPAGFACQPKNDGEGARIECTNNAVDIAAGKTQSLTFSLKAKVPADSAAGSITARVDLTIGNLGGTASNSIAFNDAPAKAKPGQGGAQAADGAPFLGEHLEDRLPPQQCAHIAVEPAANKGGGGKVTPKEVTAPNGVTFGKTPAEGVATCADDGDCKFAIRVRNDTRQSIPGPIVLKEEVSGLADGGPVDGTFFGGTAISSPPAAPWKCGRSGQTFQCTHPGPLEPGANADFIVGFKLGSGKQFKAVQNCVAMADADSKVCVSVPMSPLAPDAKPAEPPAKLQLTKTAMANTCTVNGGCVFNISIRNLGPGKFHGPIVLHDMPKLDGVPFEPVIDDSSGIGGGNWECDPPKAGAGITCTLSAPEDADEADDPTSLDVGENAPDLKVSLKPGAAGADAKQFENCATLEGHDEIAPACATIALTKANGPQLRVEKIPMSDLGACSGSFCAFVIIVRNVGDATYKGPVTIFDDLVPATGVTLISASTTEAKVKWACSSPSPSRQQCTVAGGAEIPAGGAIAVLLQMTMVSANDYVGQNCATVVPDPNQPADIVFDNTQPNRCVPVNAVRPPAPAGVAAPNLAVTKAPMTETCPLAGPCEFIVVIRNAGPGPFSGPVIVNETVTGSPPKSLKVDAPWACFPGGDAISGVNCRLEAADLKPGGDPLEMHVVVVPNAGALKGNMLENCATYLPLAVLDGQAGDDRACASIKLDPFNVKVAKTGDAACSPGGECHFTIDLFDPGPIPHDAPVTISDKLDTGTARITAIAPVSGRPFPCADMPTQIPFTCTSSGNYPLEVGEHVTFRMTVVMPADAEVQKFVNCATVASSRSGVGSVEAETACATVAARPPQTPASCFANMVADADGNCACPDGMEWNGRDCGSGGAYGVLPPCPAGMTGTYPDCKVANPVPPPPSNPTRTPTACFSNMVADANGNCACPDGMEWNGKDCGSGGAYGVLPQCPAGMHGVYPKCKPDRPAKVEPAPRCPAGTHGVYPKCTPDRPAKVEPTPRCPAGTHGVYPKCTPDRPAKVEPTPRCPAGTHGVYPRCRPDKAQPPQQCPNGMVGTYPDCQCPEGMHRVGRRCRSDQPQTTRQCPNGMAGTPPNDCHCREGTEFSWRKRTCVPVRQNNGSGGSNGTKGDDRTCPQGMTGKPPNCCPPGTRATRSGQCVAPEPQKQEPAADTGGRTCGGGMIGRPPHCRCPAGKHLSKGSRRCVADAPKQNSGEPDDRIDYGGSAGSGSGGGIVVK